MTPLHTEGFFATREKGGRTPLHLIDVKETALDAVLSMLIEFALKTREIIIHLLVMRS